MKVQNIVVLVGGKEMRNKNGVRLNSDIKTTCADGDSCTCHGAEELCSVCLDLKCEHDDRRF